MPNTDPITVFIPYDKIVMDVALRTDPTLTTARIQQYAEIMNDSGGWGPFPTVKVYVDEDTYTHYLSDGSLRIQAYLQIMTGLDANPDIPCTIKPGGRRAAIWNAVGENAITSLERSPADMRRAVMTLLEDGAWKMMSNGAIAKQTNTSISYVQRLRTEVEEAWNKLHANGVGDNVSGNVAPTVTGQDNRTIKTDKIGKTVYADLEELKGIVRTTAEETYVMCLNSAPAGMRANAQAEQGQFWRALLETLEKGGTHYRKSLLKKAIDEVQRTMLNEQLGTPAQPRPAPPPVVEQPVDDTPTSYAGLPEIRNAINAYLDTLGPNYDSRNIADVLRSAPKHRKTHAFWNSTIAILEQQHLIARDEDLADAFTDIANFMERKQTQTDSLAANTNIRLASVTELRIIARRELDLDETILGDQSADILRDAATYRTQTTFWQKVLKEIRAQKLSYRDDDLATALNEIADEFDAPHPDLVSNGKPGSHYDFNELLRVVREYFPKDIATDDVAAAIDLMKAAGKHRKNHAVWRDIVLELEKQHLDYDDHNLATAFNQAAHALSLETYQKEVVAARASKEKIAPVVYESPSEVTAWIYQQREDGDWEGYNEKTKLATGPYHTIGAAINAAEDGNTDFAHYNRIMQALGEVVEEPEQPLATIEQLRARIQQSMIECYKNEPDPRAIAQNMQVECRLRRGAFLQLVEQTLNDSGLRFDILDVYDTIEKIAAEMIVEADAIAASEYKSPAPAVEILTVDELKATLHKFPGLQKQSDQNVAILREVAGSERTTIYWTEIRTAFSKLGVEEAQYDTADVAQALTELADEMEAQLHPAEPEPTAPIVKPTNGFGGVRAIVMDSATAAKVANGGLEALAVVIKANVAVMAPPARLAANQKRINDATALRTLYQQVISTDTRESYFELTGDRLTMLPIMRGLNIASEKLTDMINALTKSE